jgi:hypothetical protein
VGLLRELKVPYKGLDAGSVRWLAESPHLPRLVGLDLACQAGPTPHGSPKFLRGS